MKDPTLSEVRKLIDEAIEISGANTEIRIYNAVGDLLMGPLTIGTALDDDSAVEFE
jgi:hypothetical protein